MTTQKYRRSFLEGWGIWYGFKLQLAIDQEGLKLNAESAPKGIIFQGSWLLKDLMKKVIKVDLVKGDYQLIFKDIMIFFDLKTGFLKEYRLLSQKKGDYKRMVLKSFKKINDNIKTTQEIISSFKAIKMKSVTNPVLVTPFMTDYMLFMLKKLDIKTIQSFKDDLIRKRAVALADQYNSKQILQKAQKQLLKDLKGKELNVMMEINKIVTPIIIEGMSQKEGQSKISK